MSVSRVVFGTLVTAVIASAMGCKVEASVKTKTRFVEPNVLREDAAEWTGQPIKIQIEGVGAAVNGGINVEANPAATKVTANARLLAMAFEDEKANADQSIVEVKETFTISNTPAGITVSCGHGNSHGSSSAGESGCELVNIVVPAGTADKPLSIEVFGGNGTMNLQLRNAVLKSIGVNNKGDISAEIPSTQGATATFLAPQADDVAVGLPSNWAADQVVLNADADKIDTTAFGPISGSYGTPGTGLASLSVTSSEFAGSTGTVTLRAY